VKLGLLGFSCIISAKSQGDPPNPCIQIFMSANSFFRISDRDVSKAVVCFRAAMNFRSRLSVVASL